MDLELSGCRVVITGASRGIGLACAHAFAAEGAKVVGLARSAEGLAQAREVLAAAGHAMAVHPVDLRDAASTREIFDRIAAEHGPVDVLVNSAGAARRRPPDELDAAALHEAMDAKYFTYMHAIDAVIRGMAARGRGAIVNVIGQGGRQANALHIGGGAANAALMLATVGYAQAYAAQGVRVNAINPGITRTDRMEEGLAAAMRASGLDRAAALAQQMAGVPMGRPAEPEEVADLAVYLASARAGYVTGAIVPMDGGKASVI
ncbi:SDR family oxidoreductase [Dyella ginsengisoli]|uniref:SDR family oxidoreductase n=1 Tax=Dyella ginsengisoli TaxID=363848 RepID=A0ABW8JWM7_9GAMM